MKNILVIGSINADMVIYTDRMPQIGETISGRDFTVNQGGKGANQAVCAARLGGSVKMMGCVGNDANGEMIIRQLKDFGVGTDGIAKTDKPTGTAVITVCGGDNCIILDGGSNMLVTPEYIDKNTSLLEWADYVVFQFEIPIETVLYAAKKAKEMGKTVVVNPAPMKNFDKELLSYTDIFTPNRIECETLLNRSLKTNEDLEKAIRDINAMGVKNVIITLGSDGCIYNDGSEIKKHGIIKCEVVDTTAAGDSFLGGVLVTLARGETMESAVNFATYTSSITVSREGAGKSVPTYDEVISRMKQC